MQQPIHTAMHFAKSLNSRSLGRTVGYAVEGPARAGRAQSEPAEARAACGTRAATCAESIARPEWMKPAA